jgi:CheY-like chemotaxis protein
MAQILIVDDAADVRTLLSVCFLHAGHMVVTARHGAEALACVAAHAPDLLITDLRMPVLDGLALLRGLRAAGHADLPVIVLTGQSADRAAARAAGAHAFLVKPVPLAELVTVAERLLTERRAERVAG